MIALNISRIRYTSSLTKEDLKTILSKPSWSLKSLLPEKSQGQEEEEQPQPSSNTPITVKQLHHLLRLSALPPPTSPAEEVSMLKTLSSQIHFVREVQSVDTTDVQPLRALRDETSQAVEENTIRLSSMQKLFDLEDKVGKNRRIRRRRREEVKLEQSKEAGEIGSAQQRERKSFAFDPLELAQIRRGRFFVVRRERKKMSEQVETSDSAKETTESPSG